MWTTNSISKFSVEKDIKALLAQSEQIDTIVLACTHYPLLLPIIEQFVPAGIQIISQGPIVAASLKNYLHRHPEVESLCKKEGSLRFLTTDSPEDFEEKATIFFGSPVHAEHIKV